MICSKCGFENREDFCFCSKCGEKRNLLVQTETMCCPECKKTFDVMQVYCSVCGNLLKRMSKQAEIIPNEKSCSAAGRELQRLTSVSKFEGTPSMPSWATHGTLILYDDRLELKRTLGNKEVYWFKDIASVWEGKYMGIWKSIVLTMKNGNVVSFGGNAVTGNNTIRLAVQKINDLIQ